MKCKVKKTFFMGTKIFSENTENEFTDEQTKRLSEFIEPVKVAIKNIDSPHQDKMIKSGTVVKKEVVIKKNLSKRRNK